MESSEGSQSVFAKAMDSAPRIIYVSAILGFMQLVLYSFYIGYIPNSIKIEDAVFIFYCSIISILHLVYMAVLSIYPMSMLIIIHNAIRSMLNIKSNFSDHNSRQSILKLSINILYIVLIMALALNYFYVNIFDVNTIDKRVLLLFSNVKYKINDLSRSGFLSTNFIIIFFMYMYYLPYVKDRSTLEDFIFKKRKDIFKVFSIFIIPLAFFVTDAGRFLADGSATFSGIRKIGATIIIKETTLKNVNDFAKKRGVEISTCVSADRNYYYMDEVDILWHGPGSSSYVRFKNDNGDKIKYIEFEINKDDIKIVRSDAKELLCKPQNKNKSINPENFSHIGPRL